jgi:hypothetical protein
MDIWASTLIARIHENEVSRLRSLRECQAVDAALAGDGACVVAKGMLCPDCRALPMALWFPSRGWICTICEGEMLGKPPTAEQRHAGRPAHGVLDRLIAVINRNLMDAEPCP